MPTLFTNATIHTLGPTAGDLHHADLLIDGATIAAGRGANAEVVDCTGLSIVPIAALSSLTPGSPASFAVIRTDIHKPWEYVIWRPENAVHVVIDGVSRTTVPDVPHQPSASPYVGMWIDETGYLHQELTAGGRYDETRDGRRHAYRGAFWITGSRIVYRDDLGFWAYGTFRDDVLHHAGYTLTRSVTRE